ncbi:DUF927 domain-containing protein [Parasutterella excrementihominis]|jgi:putative DNA primase/helicase|uniref:DUF927 domain-containing protein n=2 Tax=Parasutterella excrementihominis TaxID=487175 RepID=UPI00248ABE09|nr:DUF927 domain-containing protein [Parasutterella excrementihominis]
MIIEFMLVKSAKNPLGTPQKVETFEDFARIVQNARNARENDPKDGPAICAPMKDNKRKDVNVLPRNWVAIDIDGGKQQERDVAGKVYTPKGTDSLGISPQVLEALKEVLKPYSCFIYPTHSDTPTARKYRAVLALDKDLGPKDWQICTHNFCSWLMEKVPELAEQPDKLITAAIDSASYTPAQIMYTVPKEKAASLELFSGTPIATAQFTKGSETKKKALAKIGSTAPTPEAEGFKPELKHVDPILEALTERGLILRDMGGGKYAIKCPSGEHDDGSLTSTAYFAPGSQRDNGKRYRYGAICCMHDTCKSKGRGTEAFLSMLGMEYAAYCREIDQQEANPDLFTASSGEYSTVNGVVYLSVYKVLAGKVTKGPKEALFPEIEIIGQARDPDGQGWGRLIAFRNNDRRRLEVLIQDSDLTGKGDNVREALTSAGLPLYSTGRNIARYLCDYIYNRPIVNRENSDLLPQKVAIARRGGWLGNAFITPNGVIGDSEERVYYEPAGNAKANYDQAGSIEKWCGSVGYLARYSSPLTLAICTALAAPLLSRISWVEQKSGGFHFYSTSTVGKTSISEAAAGVYGKPSPDGGRVISWSGTANALECVAAAHNDSLMCMDELKTAKFYDVNDIIYRLSSGVGKPRMDKDTNLRKPLTWQVLWISTGELTVSQYLKKAGADTHAGTDIRSIPIDVGMGVRAAPMDRDTLGIFEAIPPRFKTISEAFKLLSIGTRENYGELGHKWLEYLTVNAEALETQAEPFARAFEAKAPKEIGAQQSRELNRFKLCAVAGEIATKAGLTGWQEGQATDAAIKLMERYFAGLTTGTKEARRLIESLQEAAQTLYKFALYGTSERAEYGYRNFEPCGIFPCEDSDTGEDLTDPEIKPVRSTPKQKRLMFLDSVFPKLIGNYSPEAACEELIHRGLLIQNDKDKKGRPRLQAKVKAGDMNGRFYTVDYDKLMNYEESD